MVFINAYQMCLLSRTIHKHHTKCHLVISIPAERNIRLKETHLKYPFCTAAFSVPMDVGNIGYMEQFDQDPTCSS